MNTILLKFAGPLQSWGTSSQFETRSTDRYPSKSAVVGLLAASYGYQRDDTRIEQFNQLDFAVRIDQPGQLLRDYHIAQKIKPNGQLERTYVTDRYYLQDAVFVVALGSKDVDWLQEIERALKAPYFQPFLGRRSNPLTADFFIGTEKKDVMNCLRDLDWQASAWYKKKHADNRLISVYADAHLLEDVPQQMVRDLAVSFSQKERLHNYRAVARTAIELSPPFAKDEHDAYNAF